MRKFLLLLLLPIFGCGSCDLTKAIDNTSKLVTTARKGAKVILDDRCLTIVKEKCGKSPKGTEPPPCPEYDKCKKLRRTIYTNASRIQISLASALAYEGIDNAKAKTIYQHTIKAVAEFLGLLSKHKLVLEGVNL